MSSAGREVVLELVGIHKAHRGCVANRGTHLTVRAGEIHAVVGENGAGKSTLLQVAYGSVRADAGTIRLRGQGVALGEHSPRVALARGVGMVHQHFMLVPNLSVLENVVLGREPMRGRRLDLEQARAEVAPLCRRLRLDVDLDRATETLSVGEQQRVEILKILWRGAEVLLLDEPTAVLTPPEVTELFAVLRGLASEGKAIVLVTHRLDEVTALADVITVLRRGEVVEELPRGTSAETIAAAMVGHELGAVVLGAKASPPPAALAADAKVVLDVKQLSVGTAVRELSLSVRAGEIVGLAGVLGNGQTELFEALAGLRPITGGQVLVAGRDLTSLSPRARAEAGLGHVPEDRQRRGLVLDFSVAENLILGRQREFTGRFGLGLDRERIERFARERLRDLDVRPDDPAARARSLSGGNQQKVVVTRELTRPGLRALLVAEPTRGVDVGASARLHDGLRAAAARGVAILLVSSELGELRALAHRIGVLYKGRLAAFFDAAASTDEVLAPLMTGAAG